MPKDNDPLGISPQPTKYDPLGILTTSDDPLSILPQPSRKETLRSAGEVEWQKPPQPGLEEPWVPNPFEMIGAVGAAGTKLGMGLGRAALSGLTAAVAEYPIGMATEEIESKHPYLALPFNIITGMLSGITIERAVEKGIIRALTKQGLKPPQKNINLLKSRVMNELRTGAKGDDLTQAAGEKLTRVAEKPETQYLRKEFGERFKVEPVPKIVKPTVKAPVISPITKLEVLPKKEPTIGKTIAEIHEVIEKEMPRLRRVEEFPAKNAIYTCPMHPQIITKDKSRISLGEVYWLPQI